MEKRTLYTEIRAVDSLVQRIKGKLHSEVVRGEVMELVVLAAAMTAVIKKDFRNYPEVVDQYDVGEAEVGDTLKAELDYLQTLIKLVNYGVKGKADSLEKLPVRANQAEELIDKILEKWDFPDVIKDFPYPEEEETEEEGDEYDE